MTEADAKVWIAERFGASAVDRLTAFANLLVQENGRQNLIAPSTVPQLWVRHLLDSAQLAEFGAASGTWLDIGTGGGMPGLVLALLLDRSFELVEPRRLRASFLTDCVDRLNLAQRVTVHAQRVETVKVRAATISARAVSSIGALLTSARHCATHATVWVMPRGQYGQDEVQSLAMPGSAKFHVKQSLTDAAAWIVTATGVGG